MRVPLVPAVTFVSCLAAAGCGTTITLKNGSTSRPAQASTASLVSPASAPGSPGATGSPAGAAGVPPASGAAGPPSTMSAASSIAAHNAPPQAGKAPRRHVSMSDRMASGFQTGSVGAFFGSFGGPIGFAAGGGTGFLVGFVAGRSPFGPVAADDDASGGSWERQVESQRVWEAQVRDQLGRLDAQAPGGASAANSPDPGIPPAQGIPRTSSGVPVTDVVAVSGGADPMAEYDAWSRQITAYAQPNVARTTPEPEASRKAPPRSRPESTGSGDAAGRAASGVRGHDDHVSAVDSNGDGRQDAWFIYDAKTLRMHASDRNGDGRPDREDLYTQGRVTSRRLDDDADGRFETIETIDGDTVTGWAMDLDGDGRYESRSVKDPDGVYHVERDTDGDGRTDAWIMMVGEGAKAAVREQVDTDGDGRPDTTTIYMDGHVVKQAAPPARSAQRPQPGSPGATKGRTGS